MEGDTTMKTTIRRIITALRNEDRGASLVEYGLLVALIALVAIGGLRFFGDNTGSSVGRSSSCIVAAQEGQTLPSNC